MIEELFGLHVVALPHMPPDRILLAPSQEVMRSSMNRFIGETGGTSLDRLFGDWLAWAKVNDPGLLRQFAMITNVGGVR